MSIEWFNVKPKDCIATITMASITLNKPATNYFEDAYAVMLGIEKNSKEVLIRPIDKTEIERKNISDSNYYKITVKSSYSRVTNKSFVELIADEFEITFDDSSKFKANWDEKARLLRIKLMEVVQ